MACPLGDINAIPIPVPLKSGYGTLRNFGDVRIPVAVGGKADIMARYEHFRF
jgi:hypothetical protein